MSFATRAASMACAAALRPFRAALHFANHRKRHSARGGHTHRRTELRRMRLAYLEQFAPVIGAGIGAAESVFAIDGTPPWPSASGRIQTCGASCGFGALASPAIAAFAPRRFGNPELLGVGACACIHAASAIRASNTSRRRVAAIIESNKRIHHERTSHREP